MVPISLSSTQYHIVFYVILAPAGGCLRIPSSLCGVCGFRPSYERYDTSGMLHQSITRDTPGAIARTVEDLQMIDAILKTTAVRGAAPEPKPGATAAQPGGSGGAGAAAGAGGAGASGGHGIMHAVASAVKSVTGKPIAGESRAAVSSLSRGLLLCSSIIAAAYPLACVHTWSHHIQLRRSSSPPRRLQARIFGGTPSGSPAQALL